MQIRRRAVLWILLVAGIGSLAATLITGPSRGTSVSPAVRGPSEEGRAGSGSSAVLAVPDFPPNTRVADAQASNGLLNLHVRVVRITNQGMEGVPGASVEFRSTQEGQPPDIGTTDNQGVLAFRVSPVACSLTAWHGSLVSDAVIVEPEEITRGEVRLLLGPALQVSGWIHDGNTGAPIGGARVWIPGLMEVQPVFSDETGWYEFDLLPANGKGRVLTFAAEGYASEFVLVFANADLSWKRLLPPAAAAQSTHALSPSSRVLSPSPRLPGQANMVSDGRELRGVGSPIPLNIDLLSTAAFTLRVVSHLHAPLEGVAAAVSGYVDYAPGVSAPDEAHDTSSASGEIELEGLRPNMAHRLVLRCEGFAALSLVLHPPLSPRTALGDVQLTPGFTIAGRILGDAEQDVRVELEGGPLQEVPHSLLADRPLLSLSVEPDDLGSFRFLHVPAGEYDVKARLDGNVASSLRIEVTESDLPQLEILLPPR